MHHVIFRDDDTNAFTPAECLERLYRPLLDRGWPVNLATIPEVSTSARTAAGTREKFLPLKVAAREPSRAIGANSELLAYLHQNPGYKIVQHGLHHDHEEFGSGSNQEISAKLERGTQLLLGAGFAAPAAFVAPQDKLCPAALREVARRFRVVSTGWFELRRLPCAWWPRYLLKKCSRSPHWRVGSTLLLSHPGCLLSCYRDYSTMLDNVVRHVRANALTVLVTHWWEYFREGSPDEEFIRQLHRAADELAKQPDVKVISFHDLCATQARMQN